MDTPLTPIERIMDISGCTAAETDQVDEIIRDVLPMSREGRRILNRAFREQVSIALQVVRS